MTKVFINGYNLSTSLGLTTAENIQNLKKGISGIKCWENKSISQTPVFCSRITTEIPCFGLFTRLENLLIHSVSEALKVSEIDISCSGTVLIFSTTKGNIDLLDPGNILDFDKSRLYLWKMAEIIAGYFKNPNRPVVVSNACISGLLSIMIGARLIESGIYDHAVITGGDLVTEFVISGFQSFKALGSTPCKPFDVNRDGLSLGEGAGTLILSRNKNKNGRVQVIFSGGASSNDANHISGPSRTGDELFYSIRNTLDEAGLRVNDVSFVNAHGTATPYNDEMESKAFITAGLSSTPLNSLKGYFGHTLGAAGIIETITGIESLKGNFLIKTAGYEVPDISYPVTIIDNYEEKKLDSFLKTASGFGGCNAAAIFRKI